MWNELLQKHSLLITSVVAKLALAVMGSCYVDQHTAQLGTFVEHT